MKKIITLLTLLVLPSVASAQFGGSMNLIFGAANIVDGLTVLTFGIALLVFFWGLVKYIRKAGSGDVEEGRALMIWGVVALFVLVSVWGLVRFIQGELLPGGDYSDVTIPGFQ